MAEVSFQPRSPDLHLALPELPDPLLPSVALPFSPLRPLGKGCTQGYGLILGSLPSRSKKSDWTSSCISPAVLIWSPHKTGISSHTPCSRSGCFPPPGLPKRLSPGTFTASSLPGNGREVTSEPAALVETAPGFLPPRSCCYLLYRKGRECTCIFLGGADTPPNSHKRMAGELPHPH